MRLIISLWSSYDESPANFVETVERFSGLSFGTILPGGYGGCSFNVEVSGWNAIRWYRDYLGHHVVIFDHLGRRVYEGRIEVTDASIRGVKVTVSGYYSHAQDETHGIIYPVTVPASISDVIEDTVDLASQWWSGDHSQIKVTVTDITPQDFTGEQKLRDAIEAVLKFGDDGVIPVPLHFAIWNHRRPYLFAEPDIIGDEPDWQVSVKDFAKGRGLALNRSIRGLFNKIQVLYDDPDIGPTFTDWEEDLVSQNLFWLREGSINIGAALTGIATTIGELAINAYSKPKQTSRLGITGKVKTKAGAPDFPYMVRAGDLVRINDYDPSVAQLVSGQGGEDAAIAVINSTRYNYERNQLELQLGSKSVAMDLLMARLGMSSGSVR
jgi:hypothetical protein